uniref:Uncharacterized protein n=1 Tax=Arundo donax TaxID=35708 RepID=A0A0A9G4H5_ARUDO
MNLICQGKKTQGGGEQHSIGCARATTLDSQDAATCQNASSARQQNSTWIHRWRTERTP